VNFAWHESTDLLRQSLGFLCRCLWRLFPVSQSLGATPQETDLFRLQLRHRTHRRSLPLIRRGGRPTMKHAATPGVLRQRERIFACHQMQWGYLLALIGGDGEKLGTRFSAYPESYSV
jgi:hypothetical protein